MRHRNSDLEACTNENGGGLSTLATGKYTSVRHERAKRDGKLTAGEAAKQLSKYFGQKILAKDIRPFATEWHHSGFYSKGMGKTWFFTQEDVERLKITLPDLLVEAQAKKKIQDAEIARKKETIIRGFYYRWESDRNGRFGKKRNFKVLDVYEGPENDTPKNFTELTPAQFQNAKSKVGQQYFGWEEPTALEFNDHE